MKWLGAICKGGIGLATCYLHSNIGVTAKRNLDLLHAIAAALSRAGEGGYFRATLTAPRSS